MWSGKAFIMAENQAEICQAENPKTSRCKTITALAVKYIDKQIKCFQILKA